MKGLLRRISEGLGGARPTPSANVPGAVARTPRELVEAALAHHRAGRLVEAEALYREVLAADPEDFDALHMLGVVHQQTGRSAEAAALIEKAVVVAPGNAMAHSNLSHAYQSLHRLGDAEASLRKAITLNPDWDAPHNSLGVVLRAANRSEDAAACFRKAVEVNPANRDALGNLGRICRERGEFDAAIESFRRSLALAPGDASPLAEIGAIHAALGELAQAEARLRAALEIDESRFDATCNLADVLRRLGRMDEAERVARVALALQPDDPDALNTLACILLRTAALDEAEACCRKALSIRSNDALSRITLGSVLNARGRSSDAEASFRDALRLHPDAAGARYNLAMLTLLRGDYSEGLALYESRFDVMRRDFGMVPAIAALLADPRRWTGDDLNGRRILVWAEQGFGDTLMMLRYLPMLVARGAGEVIVLCDRALGRVACSVTGMNVAVTSVQAISADAFDVHCPFMSLPLLFDTTLETIPDRVPYIDVPGGMSAAWEARMAAVRGPRVGLSWAGARTLREDDRRSVPLDVFAPLISSSSAQFVSLQKERNAAELGAWDGRILDWMDDCGDFLDTAALVRSLDLVISVDTAVAHLAGALGVPVWLLNRHGSEWRWGLETERSPWYPTMRIFRQREADGWDKVVASVAEALGEFQTTQHHRDQS